ncbi:MAG TPA: alpha/beta fold hydrolase [Alcaligenaceae bacterium]|nr:alpha/beta fold hydrolase [Alcaligenaceae bacterium]
MTTTVFTEEQSSRFVDIVEDDLKAKIHYNEFGSGDETVIMLHGSGPGATSWANFSQNVEPLVNAGYRVILLDCPGWGKSDPIVVSDSRSHVNAKALKGTMDALGIKKAHLIGNSMGGHSVTAFTLDNPERVGKLILMGGGTGGLSTFTPMPTEGIKRLQALYRQPTLENLRAMMDIFVYDSSSLTDELLQQRLDNILANQEHLDNFVKSLDLNPRQFPDFGGRLTTIQAPTLIIWGRDDRFVPMDAALRLVAHIPNSEMHLFNRCGHWVQWEHKNRFNALVLDFLKGE